MVEFLIDKNYVEFGGHVYQLADWWYSNGY